jgi:hypothetical protein
MRPTVTSSVVLATVVLTGVALARDHDRREERSAEGTPTPAAAVMATPAPLLPGSTPRFRGGALPGGLDLSAPPTSLALPQQTENRARPWEFFFTRAIYGSGGGLRGWGRRGRGSWAVDYPKADIQFMVMVNHLIDIDAYDYENAVSFADPTVRRYPWIYALEVGGMYLSPEEVEGMRSYLDAGGFMVIDDFWGPREWATFEAAMYQVLPDREIVELPMDHPIFHAFYSIEEVRQVPNINNAERIARGYGNQTWECGTCQIPRVFGIFDEKDRLQVVINFNTDLGDAWEWAEDPWYPLEYSRFAAEMGINMIVYGMSH